MIIICCLCHCAVMAMDWQDDFSNTELSQSVWFGDWHRFAMNQNGQLQSQSSEAAESILWHHSTIAIDAEWRCWVRIAGTCSAYNMFRFYIAMVHEDVLSDGYFVQIGGANKNITLYEQRDGSATKIIEHPLRKKLLDTSESRVYIKVTRAQNGVFRLYSMVESQDSTWVEEGSAFAQMVESAYSAVAVKNSQKRGYDFFIDDIYVTGAVQLSPLTPTVDDETGRAEVRILTDNISPNGDGWEDDVCVEYSVPNDGYTATLYVYTANGVLVDCIYDKQALSQTGLLCWNGHVDDKVADIGVYVLYLELQNAKTRDMLRHRFAVSLTR